MTRKDFLIGASAATAQGVFGIGCRGVCGAGGPTAWESGHYQVHFIYTGRGECMFHIFPDGTTMLLDCGDYMGFYGTPAAVPIPDLSCRAGEFAARYIRRVNPKGEKVDYLHLSHYHDDHGGGMKYHDGLMPDGRPLCGLSDAARFLTFGRVIDRAWPGFDDPLDKLGPEGKGDGTAQHMKLLYRHLADAQGSHIERFELGSRRQFVQLDAANARPGFEVFNLCANGRYVRKDGSVADPYAARVAKGAKTLNENGMSCGIVVKYGKFSFFSAGDFSDGPWAKECPEQVENMLAEAVSPVTVAKLNHHGHHSNFRELVRALRPKVWTACVLDQQHCTDDTMTRLSDRSLYEGDRLLLPEYMPHDRPKTEFGTAYLKDVPQCVYDEPCHVVLDVAEGGGSYSLSCLSAMRPDQRTLKRFEFEAV